MKASDEFWHQRFTQQAGWTQSLRRHLLDQTELPSTAIVLEVGSGTGAVMTTMPHDNIIGLDIDFPRLRWARHHGVSGDMLAADGARLPLAAQSFDLTYCHYLLLWVSDPLAVLREMSRVTRPGGWVLAFAEPDYGGRIDYPDALTPLGIAQQAALRKQGANPLFGRSLRAVFHAAGLTNITTGVLGGEWTDDSTSHPDAMEQEVLRLDLQEHFSLDEVDHLLSLDSDAVATFSRTLFVPTFYAIGRVSTTTLEKLEE